MLSFIKTCLISKKLSIKKLLLFAILKNKNKNPQNTNEC